MSQNSLYDHQTTIRVSSGMWEEIIENAKRSHITTMEWIRRACDEKLHRVNEGDELIPIQGMSYHDLEGVIRVVLDKVLDEKLREVDSQIDKMDEEMGISNRRPTSPSLSKI